MEILEGTLLYTPAECFHWRGSFHSLSTGGGASSLPMSRTVPGSSSRFGWARLGLIKVIVFSTFIKVITWQKNHSPVDFRYALTVLESPTQALQIPVVYVEHHPLHVEASGNIWNWKYASEGLCSLSSSWQLLCLVVCIHMTSPPSDWSTQNLWLFIGQQNKEGPAFIGQKHLARGVLIQDISSFPFKRCTL